MRNRKTVSTRDSSIQKRSVKERNWIAVAAHFRSGAGSHKDTSKYSRKTKHKGRSKERL